MVIIITVTIIVIMIIIIIIIIIVIIFIIIIICILLLLLLLILYNYYYYYYYYYHNYCYHCYYLIIIIYILIQYISSKTRFPLQFKFPAIFISLPRVFVKADSSTAAIAGVFKMKEQTILHSLSCYVVTFNYYCNPACVFFKE